MSECSAPTCQPQAQFVCAEHRLAQLEREREADRAAIREVAEGKVTHGPTWIAWKEKHAAALQRATEAEKP